jgi:DNA replicative helicase MCM subunit Mcm2 (Cdc46/Mcm family)
MACNPTDGRYNMYKTISENIKDFPESLLSRFDFIFIMPDIVDEENDDKIINRVLRLDGYEKQREISLETLKKYIAYSKKFAPTIPEEVLKYLKKVFKERRSQSNNSGLTISWRQAEALERACEARARAHLRNEVTMGDAEAVVRLFDIYVQATWTDPFTGKIDMNVYEGITASSRQQQAEYLPNIIEHMYRDGRGICDALGELFVRRGDLIKEVERLGQLDTFIANKVLDLAIEKDLVWAPGIDKIKIKGDRNRMLGNNPQTLNT